MSRWSLFLWGGVIVGSLVLAGCGNESRSTAVATLSAPSADLILERTQLPANVENLRVNVYSEGGKAEIAPRRLSKPVEARRVDVQVPTRKEVLIRIEGFDTGGRKVADFEQIRSFEAGMQIYEADLSPLAEYRSAAFYQVPYIFLDQQSWDSKPEVRNRLNNKGFVYRGGRLFFPPQPCSWWKLGPDEGGLRIDGQGRISVPANLFSKGASLTLSDPSKLIRAKASWDLFGEGRTCGRAFVVTYLFKPQSHLSWLSEDFPKEAESECTLESIAQDYAAEATFAGGIPIDFLSQSAHLFYQGEPFLNIFPKAAQARPTDCPSHHLGRRKDSLKPGEIWLDEKRRVKTLRVTPGKTYEFTLHNNGASGRTFFGAEKTELAGKLTYSYPDRPHIQEDLTPPGDQTKEILHGVLRPGSTETFDYHADLKLRYTAPLTSPKGRSDVFFFATDRSETCYLVFESTM